MGSASAPAKAILFGEHAINRGQPALSVAVGLRTHCTVVGSADSRFHFASETRQHSMDVGDIHSLRARIDRALAEEDFATIRALVAADYFAAPTYVLANVFGDTLPSGLRIEWRSEIPSSSGLGSGGAAFVALVTALLPFLPVEPSLAQRSRWAHRGDVVAHGGIASALDTQTSLWGGVVRYGGEGLAEPVACAPGLRLVIGHTGVQAATSEINGRVRAWLSEHPQARMPMFGCIGALSRAALPLLARGDWQELGRLLLLNQLVLREIGVSCLEIDHLVAAALEAGAFGAKLSGSGGGGIVIALVDASTEVAVAQAMTVAGGTVFVPAVGVAGAQSHVQEHV
jgi:mevalonate kinase